jgi:prepilin-type N-terminal cleavage/methylation domain-containing protein
MSVSRNALTFNTLHFRTHPTLTVVVVWRECCSLAETLGSTPCLPPKIGMLPDTPHSVFSPRARSSNRGFTLIELLVVIAIIMILAGITFGISRGVQNAQARTRAKAELAVIAQALESYKSTYGDYPWTQNEEGDAAGLVLTKALLGWKVFVRSGTTTTFKDKAVSEVPSSGPKAFVDPTKLGTSGTIPSAPTTKPTDLAFTDPWGNEYVYAYKQNSSSWDNFGFILYSKGADSSAIAVGTNGILTTDIRGADDNIDNIYSGE